MFSFVFDGPSGVGKDLYFSNLKKHFKGFCYHIYSQKNLERVKYIKNLQCVIVYESLLYGEAIKVNDINMLDKLRRKTYKFIKHVPFKFFNRSYLSTIKYQLSRDYITYDDIQLMQEYYGYFFVNVYAATYIENFEKFVKGIFVAFDQMWYIL